MANAKEGGSTLDVHSAIDEAEERDAGSDSESDVAPRSRGSNSAPRSVAPSADVSSAGRGIHNVVTIALRELRSYFDSLVAYVVLGGSMFALGALFFADLPLSASFWRIDRASMAHMFEFLPFLLGGLVIPLVTMRSVAEERRSGTLELLITMPVRDSEVILGKYLGAVAMVLILFVATLIYPIAMFKWPWNIGSLDWGPVSAGYLGLVLYALAGVAIGLFFSAITESQIIAFFTTMLTLGFLHGTGYFVDRLHGWLGDALAFVSFGSHFSGFERGLIESKSVVYFLSIAVLFLLLAFRSLESRKWK